MPNPNGNPDIVEAGKATQFKKGNQEGKKSGRKQLTTALVKLLLEDFEKNGTAAIEKMRQDKPEQYVATIARLMPAQFSDEDDNVIAPPSIIALVAPDRPLPTVDDDED